MAKKESVVFDVRNDAHRVEFSRLISNLHNNPRSARNLLQERYGNVQPRAHVIGITGVTGSGKSTFINYVLSVFVADGFSVVVLAIDPSSQKAGGALLGDRIRMRDHYLDQGVFIRSLATRGARASLTFALREIIRASTLFADIVLVETAGSGQVDTDINKFVDTLVVMVAPLGDEITMMKSGQIEYAHLIVVNTRKGMPENNQFLQKARAILGHEVLTDGWQRKVFQVDALHNEGVAEFIRDGLYAHKEWVRKKGGS